MQEVHGVMAHISAKIEQVVSKVRAQLVCANQLAQLMLCRLVQDEASAGSVIVLKQEDDCLQHASCLLLKALKSTAGAKHVQLFLPSLVKKRASLGNNKFSNTKSSACSFAQLGSSQQAQQVLQLSRVCMHMTAVMQSCSAASIATFKSLHAHDSSYAILQ